MKRNNFSVPRSSVMSLQEAIRLSLLFLARLTKGLPTAIIGRHPAVRDASRPKGRRSAKRPAAIVSRLFVLFH
jgi:hypothetical protein